MPVMLAEAVAEGRRVDAITAQGIGTSASGLATRLEGRAAEAGPRVRACQPSTTQRELRSGPSVVRNVVQASVGNLS